MFCDCNQSKIEIKQKDTCKISGYLKILEIQPMDQDKNLKGT